MRGQSISRHNSDATPVNSRSQYVTLRSDDAPPQSPPTQYAATFPFYSDDSDGEEPMVRRDVRSTAWWHRLRHGSPPSEQPQSAYLTLIPLSDSRLKPQHTKLIVGTLLFLTLISVCFVYFAVARGVTIGSIEVVNSTISFNTSRGTYQLVLWTQLPVYNPNYASVRVSGRINVSFYDQQAGFTVVEPVVIPARSQPEIMIVDINSSSVPHKYLFTIYTQCFTFPEKLIFFLTAELKSQYLGTTYSLPRIDNYAIVGCQGSQAKDKKKGGVMRDDRLEGRIETLMEISEILKEDEEEAEDEAEDEEGEGRDDITDESQGRSIVDRATDGAAVGTGTDGATVGGATATSKEALTAGTSSDGNALTSRVSSD